MRAGELLGLRWSSIDFLLSTARVERTFYRMGGKQLFQEPKTEKGRRVVDILPSVVAVLRELKAQQSAIKREMGSTYTGLDLVFCQPDGKPLHLHNIVSRDFRRVTKKAGLPPIRFHDLRHSHATDLLAHGENPKVVQERLGHYDPSVYSSRLLARAARDAGAGRSTIGGAPLRKTHSRRVATTEVGTERGGSGRPALRFHISSGPTGRDALP